MPQLFCFGDSITYGSRDFEQGGWATRLRSHLDRKRSSDPSFYSLSYVLGIPSETSSGLVKRFGTELACRISQRTTEKSLIIIATGANDSALVPSTGQFMVSPETYRDNLSALLTEARRHTEDILFLNITPVIDSVTGSIPGKDKSRLNQYVEQFNAVLAQFCQSNDMSHIDVYSEFMKYDLTTLFDADGLHPNTRGHELLFNQVLPFVNDWL